MTAIEREELMRGTKEGAPHTSKRIQDEALKLFFERGFKSTTMREIALACGLTPGALYNHFSSKEELLGSMLVEIHREMESRLGAALQVATSDPKEQLRSFAHAHALMHTVYIIEARVGNREIGSVNGDVGAEVVRIRQWATTTLRDILELGRADGDFDVPNVAAVANLILTMGMAIAKWYRTGGELTREEMADLHADMVMRMVSKQSGGRQ
ncbi:MAG TPA: TetR/AcrR family transcriptional regulator [Actinomycetota bacterium]|nr:TetR/AcrR family transcriptional regulator [Actinomycetota bacterium]